MTLFLLWAYQATDRLKDPCADALHLDPRAGARADIRKKTMLTGLARDGGLYVPAELPRMSHGDIAALAGLSYEEVAFRVMRPFVGDSFTDAEFRADCIARAYAGFGHAAPRAA